jgi:hypothetical protein
MISKTFAEMRDDKVLLNHKALERRQGCLLYVTRTYPSMVPYLKELHLTLDGWRKGQDPEGWKVLDHQAQKE